MAICARRETPFGWHGQVLLPVVATHNEHGQECLPVPSDRFGKTNETI